MKKIIDFKKTRILVFVVFLAVSGYSQSSTITMWKQRGVNPVLNKATNTVAFTKHDSAGTYHIFLCDTLGNNERQLTYPGWPSCLHQFPEEWDPSGQYLICYVEKADTNIWDFLVTGHTRVHNDATPGFGWYTDIWAIKPDGSQAWKLTNLKNDFSSGVLHGAISPDGKVFGWTERISLPTYYIWPILPTEKLPFGQTIFRLADWVLTPSPHFENIRTFNPGNVVSCGELESIAGDNKTIAFYSTLETQNIFTTPIYTMDTVTKVPRKLSSGVGSQCPTFTPDDKHIIYMSSNGCDKFPTQVMLGADWYIMDLDSSNRQRVTYMNVTNNPQSVNDYRLAGTLTFLSNTSFLGGVLTDPSGAEGCIVKVTYDNLMTGAVTRIKNNITDFSVFPNPANNILNIFVSGTIFNKTDYWIYDLVGSKVAEGELTGNMSEINVSSYPSGMYFLKVSDGEIELTKKFLVRK